MSEKYQNIKKSFNDLKNLVNNLSVVIEMELEHAYDQGYEKGYKDAESNAQAQDPLVKDIYEKGLNDAWEYALKVGMYGCEYYKNNVFPKNPNYDVWDILRHYSASETIAKIKEYEKAQQRLDDFKVGDEVHFIDPNHKYVVTALLEAEKGVFISANGKYTTNYLSQAVKTGKHYSELEKMLDELKGNN